ncbi:MAG: PilZ domain-containing protein, partial [Gammaproteobacteria bacterium]
MEKKYYGRVTKQLSAIVANEDGLRLKVVAVDTAGDSVSILCNIYQRDTITPGGCFIRDGRPVELMLSLYLPDDQEQLSPILARCHISYSRRISIEKCMIGLRYIDFEQDSHARLLRFINSTLTSNNVGKFVES